MALSKEELARQAHFVVTRTQRGNDLIARDPRQMPRRLRVLLLAIDGAQTVQLYTQTLKGFGDVSELLVELIHLGMVELVDPKEAKHALESGKTSAITALDQMMDDGRFTSENAAQVLYGSTTPGSFDDMMRMAEADARQHAQTKTAQPDMLASEAAPSALQVSRAMLAPAPAVPLRPAAKPEAPASAPAASAPPIAPIAPMAPAQHSTPVANPPTALTTDQTAQIQSLFDLLEAVRGERVNLKQQIGKLLATKDAAAKLEAKYHELKGVHAQAQNKNRLLGGLSAALAVVVVMLVVLLLNK
jgi:hypothetical protein